MVIVVNEGVVIVVVADFGIMDISSWSWPMR